MSLPHFDQWRYALAQARHQQLRQEAAQVRLLHAARATVKRRRRKAQPFALFRQGRLVFPRLQWASPADENVL
ncbi:MAG: hypothetical protein KF832_21765 [Caldilineaceae bacterium]|nr:hypothetical protein [Caldilineaceae bacterium]